MPRAIRTLGAILIGFVLLLIGTFLVDQIGLLLYPLPAGMKMGETSMADVMASRPTAALAFNVVLRLPLIVLGAFVAARIAQNNAQRNGVIVGVLFLIFSLGPAFVVRIPAWVIVGSVLLTPLCGWVGGRMASARGFTDGNVSSNPPRAMP